MRTKNYLNGILFILLGALVFASIYFPAFQIGIWSKIGMVLLACMFIKSVFYLQFVGAGVSLATFLTLITYTYKPWYELVGMPYIATSTLYIGLILLGIGLSLIFRNTRNKRFYNMYGSCTNEWNQYKSHDNNHHNKYFKNSKRNYQNINETEFDTQQYGNTVDADFVDISQTKERS